MKRFEGKVALVSGAASGIGFATARRLAQEGATILGCDINPQLNEQMAVLAAEGLSVQAQIMNVADEASCREAVESAIARFGQLDVLCNIAGILLQKHFLEMRRSEWDKVITINLTGVMLLSQAALPELIKTSGNIVNVASAAGMVGLPLSAAYCASKAGVVMLTKSLAVEFAEHNVRVNAICPGGIATPMSLTAALPEGANIQIFQRALPVTSGFGQAEDVAAGIAFLASPDAHYVTGATLAVDGGQTAI